MEKNTSETLYSLKFAERVRSVELGPGSRRAELGSWSSQEHLEVWSPPRAHLGLAQPGQGREGGSGTGDSLEWRERGRCQKGVDLELEPRSLCSLTSSPWLLMLGQVLRQLGAGGLQAGTQVLR